MLYSRIGDEAATVFDGGPSASPTPTGPSAGQAPAAPAPTAPGGINFGGFTPDYGGLITSDPAFLASKNAADAAGASAKAQRQARLRQLYVMYGGDMPDGFADQFGDIDEATRTAAAGNQNSILARLKTNYGQSREQFMRQLAARGALQSGDLNYGEDQLQRGFDQQQYDAGNQFLTDANSAYGDYLGVINGNAQSLAGAIGQAESNVSANPAYRPVPATHADYDAGTSAQYGQPIYKGADGSLYDSTGNPFSPPEAQTSPTPEGRYYNAGFGGGYIPAGGF